jgi:WD40 repeat protein
MLGFTSDEDRLVSAAADGTVRVWSLGEQRQIAKVRADASCTPRPSSRHGKVLVGSAAAVVPWRSRAPERQAKGMDIVTKKTPRTSGGATDHSTAQRPKLAHRPS